MFWYVGPWIWDANSTPNCWRPPSGLSALDLRSTPQRERRGGAPGLSLFFGDVARPQLENRADYRPLGRGNWHDLKPDAADRAAIPRRTGYVPKGDDLVGIVYDLLTDGADPDGSDGPKPIMPTIEGRMELLCGRSRHAERFRWGGANTVMVRQSLRREFAALFADAKAGRLRDAEHHRRVLDFWCDKYNLRGVDDWKELVPAAILADVPGPLRHETTLTDNFNRADNAALGTASGGGTWNEIQGDWQILSNQAYGPMGSASDVYARLDSDLSSADHYAQVSVTDLGGGSELVQSGTCARFASAASTFYMGLVRRDTSGVRLWSVSAGTFTNLSDAGVTLSIPEAYKLECNGSAIKFYQAGVERVGVTDTSITSGLRGGLYHYASGNDIAVDDFEAADLGGGGGGILYTQLERGIRGYQRGIYEGRP